MTSRRRLSRPELAFLMAFAPVGVALAITNIGRVATEGLTSPTGKDLLLYGSSGQHVVIAESGKAGAGRGYLETAGLVLGGGTASVASETAGQIVWDDGQGAITHLLGPPDQDFRAVTGGASRVFNLVGEARVWHPSEAAGDYLRSGHDGTNAFLDAGSGQIVVLDGSFTVLQDGGGDSVLLNASTDICNLTFTGDRLIFGSEDGSFEFLSGNLRESSGNWLLSITSTKNGLASDQTFGVKSQ